MGAKSSKFLRRNQTDKSVFPSTFSTGIVPNNEQNNLIENLRIREEDLIDYGSKAERVWKGEREESGEMTRDDVNRRAEKAREKIEEERKKAREKDENEKEFTNRLLLEIFSLRKELWKCKEKLGETEKQLRVAKGLPAVPFKEKFFYKFSILPPETRHMVYAKFSLRERVAAARTSSEMKAYFYHNRLESSEVHVGLCERNGSVFVRFHFYDHEYTELHRIPKRLVSNETRLLMTQRRKCLCDRCSHNDEGSKREFKYSEKLPNDLFQTLSLVDLPYLLIESDPVGGLVDLVQPTGQLKGIPEVQIQWHNPDGVSPIRNDPRVNIGNWGKWINFANAKKIIFSSEFTGESERTNSETGDGYSYGSWLYVHKALYDLKAVQNANAIEHENCGVDINHDQLFSLKATRINFSCIRFKQHMIGGRKLLLFYQQKLQQWLDSPETEFSYKIKVRHLMHLDKTKMFENVRLQLQSPDYIIYHRFNPLQLGEWYNRTSDYTVRHLKTGTAFVVSRDHVWAGFPRDQDVWPETLQ